MYYLCGWTNIPLHSSNYLIMTARDCLRLGVEIVQVHSQSNSPFLSLILMVALISRQFPAGLTSFWSFAFTILLISDYYISEPMPYCIKDCNRKFANDAALSRHRKACPVLKVVRQRSQDIQREKGIGPGRSIQDATTTTLLTRKQRLQVSDCSAFNLEGVLRYSGTSNERRDKC